MSLVTTTPAQTARLRGHCDAHGHHFDGTAAAGTRHMGDATRPTLGAPVGIPDAGMRRRVAAEERGARSHKGGACVIMLGQT
jgi:hypothetical protein